MYKDLKNYNMTYEVYDGLLYTKYFFDKAFLAKKLDNEKETDLNRQKSQDFISPLSELVDFVRDFFKL